MSDVKTLICSEDLCGISGKPKADGQCIEKGCVLEMRDGKDDAELEAAARTYHSENRFKGEWSLETGFIAGAKWQASRTQQTKAANIADLPIKEALSHLPKVPTEPYEKQLARELAEAKALMKEMEQALDYYSEGTAKELTKYRASKWGIK